MVRSSGGSASRARSRRAPRRLARPRSRRAPRCRSRPGRGRNRHRSSRRSSRSPPRPRDPSAIRRARSSGTAASSGVLEDTRDVDIDPERGGVGGVLRDPGVLADRQAQTPAVDDEDCRLGPGREPLGLGATQPHLVVGHGRTLAIDHERCRDARRPHHPRPVRRRAPCSRSRHRRHEGPSTVGHQRRSAARPARSRSGTARKDHDPSRGRADHRRVRRGVPGDVVRHDPGLGGGDDQWRGHEHTPPQDEAVRRAHDPGAALSTHRRSRPSRGSLGR